MRITSGLQRMCDREDRCDTDQRLPCMGVCVCVWWVEGGGRRKGLHRRLKSNNKKLQIAAADHRHHRHHRRSSASPPPPPPTVNLFDRIADHTPPAGVDRSGGPSIERSPGSETGACNGIIASLAVASECRSGPSDDRGHL